MISAELKGDLVTLRMTEPTDLRLERRLTTADENKTVHFINSGVPHVVDSRCEKSMMPMCDATAQRSRHHKMFSPNGTNVNFIEKRGSKQNRHPDSTNAEWKTETLACGTGMVASALIFAASEKSSEPITVLA